MSEGTHYKVSYVVEDGSYTGTIINTDREPQVGDEVVFEGAVFEVTEVTELIPATDDFGFLHATVRYVRAGGRR